MDYEPALLADGERHRRSGFPEWAGIAVGQTLAEPREVP